MRISIGGVEGGRGGVVLIPIESEEEEEDS